MKASGRIACTVRRSPARSTGRKVGRKRRRSSRSNPRRLVAPRFAIAPNILTTARDMEQVRRFVMRCLNVDYQRLAPPIKAEIAKILEVTSQRDLNKEERAQVNELKDRLTELEVDWGTIPGSKPFLKQPGAEKFCLWLNLKPKYHRTTNELGNGHVEVVCYVTFHVKTTNEEVFEGPEASCSTMETNYRYIWGESGFVPTEAQVQLGYSTKMGQWRYVDDWKNGRKIGRKKVWYIRLENPNIHNERNKVRQIGQKRGFVKGTRNLGALSELFVAGPDEWDVPPEEGADHPDSPGVDQDYTPGGRKIYHDGVAPSGRTQSPQNEWAQQAAKPVTAVVDPDVEERSKKRGTWCEKHQSDFAKCPADEHSEQENELMGEAEERAKQAERSTSTSPAPKASPAPAVSQPEGNTTASQPSKEEAKQEESAGEVEIDYTENPESPIVRGDVAGHSEELQRAGMFWNSKDEWYHIKFTDVSAFLDVLKRLTYRFKIIPKVYKPSSTGSLAQPAGRQGGSTAATQQTSAAPTPTTAEPTIMRGTIDRVNYVKTTSNKEMAYVTLKVGKVKYDLSSWSTTTNGILAEAKGKEAEVFILTKGKYRNLVGLKRVGDQEYTDGNVPVGKEKKNGSTKT